jgi:hypothetical protein
MAIALGELYRWALIDDAKTEGLGMRGIQWLPEQKSDLSSQLLSSVEEAINRYIHIAKAIKDASASQGKGNRSAFEIGGPLVARAE